MDSVIPLLLDVHVTETTHGSEHLTTRVSPLWSVKAWRGGAVHPRLHTPPPPTEQVSGNSLRDAIVQGVLLLPCTCLPHAPSLYFFEGD